MSLSVQDFARTTSLLTASVILAAASASAQGFNVDYGTNGNFPVPTNAYGAAAGQAGAWNDGSSGSVNQVLNGLNGMPSSVMLSESGAAPGGFEFNNAGTSGDDENLLDDYLDVGSPGNLSQSIFTGLANGDYLVYTYSWAADNRLAFCSQVDVVGSTDPQQIVCGAWTGSHVQGVTYALHAVTVTTGSITVNVEATPTGTFGTVNGIQIVPANANSGMAYCFGDGTGGVCPCAAFGGAGEGCLTTSGSGATLAASGSADVGNDTFQLDVTGAPANKPGLFFQGINQIANPAGDGLLCAAGATIRYGVNSTDASGAVTQGGFAINASAGQTLNYQYWFRDTGNTCGGGFNFSNGWAVTWQ